jgi:hypothetical protein
MFRERISSLPVLFHPNRKNNHITAVRPLKFIAEGFGFDHNPVRH